MRTRSPTVVALCLAAVSCGGGPPSPPALAYELPAERLASYLVGDSIRVEMQALGQTISLAALSTATYRLAFEREPVGVRVRLAVADLDAQVSVPMAGAIRVDEGAVRGELVFALDRRGRASVVTLPEVDEQGGQLFAPALTAHTFFPALPGRAVRLGDAWTDTVAFEERTAGAEGTQRLVLAYTVLGDTLLADRPLLVIGYTGTSEQDQTLSMQGARIRQTTVADVEGRVLWDAERRVMVERETTARGEGTVQVPLMPAPLPVRLALRSHATLQPAEAGR